MLLDIKSTFLPMTYLVVETTIMEVCSSPKGIHLQLGLEKSPSGGWTKTTENYLFPPHPFIRDCQDHRNLFTSIQKAQEMQYFPSTL